MDQITFFKALTQIKTGMQKKLYCMGSPIIHHYIQSEHGVPEMKSTHTTNWLTSSTTGWPRHALHGMSELNKEKNEWLRVSMPSFLYLEVYSSLVRSSLSHSVPAKDVRLAFMTMCSPVLQQKLLHKNWHISCEVKLIWMQNSWQKLCDSREPFSLSGKWLQISMKCYMKALICYSLVEIVCSLVPSLKCIAVLSY